MSEDSSNLNKSLFARRPGLGSPLGVIFNVLAVFVVGQILAGVIVELAARIFQPDFSGIDSSTIAEFFFVFLSEALAVLFVIYILKRRHLKLGVIGLGRRPKMKDLATGLLGFLAFYILLIIIAGTLSQLFPNLDKGSQDVGFNTLNTGFDAFLALFALVLLPPIGEETLVRGYLYSGLRQRWAFLPAMLVTSLIFGAAHLFSGDSGLLWSAGINTFILSVVLVRLRETTGALYAGMLVHLLNNLIAFAIHFH